MVREGEEDSGGARRVSYQEVNDGTDFYFERDSIGKEESKEKDILLFLDIRDTVWKKGCGKG